MIKQLNTNFYIFKVRNILYKICIEERVGADGTHYYQLIPINRNNWWPLCRRLGLWSIRAVAMDNFRSYLVLNTSQIGYYGYSYGCPPFNSLEGAKKFLYFLDRTYNPTPTKPDNFVNINLFYH